MQNHEAIVEYFKAKGVSMIFLFRRNLLRRRISILANAYDQNAKPLNGKHKSHVHSHDEVNFVICVCMCVCVCGFFTKVFIIIMLSG